MPRPVTLFTGQWADRPLASLAAMAADMGFDGLELACWGDHFDIAAACDDDAYCQGRHDLLETHGMKTWAVSNHLVGQAVCDRIDARHHLILPDHVWGPGDPEGVRTRAAEEMKRTARAAARLGVSVVNGFTGSSIWPDLYFFPPTPPEHVTRGYDDFAARWGPILDVFQEVGVKFALEVHPSEIAYDTVTAEAALEAVGHHEAFGFNFDPSHLVWQGVDPARFVDRFADRIFHCHMKDVKVRLDGEAGILGSHLQFGDCRRGWDFVSVGRGDVDFDAIIRSLNRGGYDGPLSIEWEDSGMHREQGARESCAYVRGIDITPPSAGFEDAFEA
ncbi:MAG: sugar phosphate isomerase/epimerase [Phycisphaerales bacterium]|jgi:sugar phosphate isomerase/epimerase|nr:sugar phosphate isomerase/epimerase [Phycisphaerales bacterium]